ncbi:regulatory helix-turn-helix protein, lysR family, partial [Acetitomaculum ruminis DSM 5522]
MVGIRHLKYFVTLYECRNYTQASKVLFVSRQTISIAIRELEEQTGLFLIKKYIRKVEITPDGEIYYKKAKLLVDEFEALTSNKTNKSKRKFSIAVNNIFFGLFPSFQRKFIELIGEKDGFFSNFYEFVEQDKVFEAIKDDMADCGIIMSMGEILDYWSFPLLKIPAHVFLNKNHPLAKNEKVTIKEITDYPVICDGNIKD